MREMRGRRWWKELAFKAWISSSNYTFKVRRWRKRIPAILSLEMECGWKKGTTAIGNYIEVGCEMTNWPFLRKMTEMRLNEGLRDVQSQLSKREKRWVQRDLSLNLVKTEFLEKPTQFSLNYDLPALFCSNALEIVQNFANTFLMT